MGSSLHRRERPNRDPKIDDEEKPDRQQQQAARALAELTEREREVMRLVIEGRPNKLIADELAISVRTVEVHRARVFEKLNVKSAVELANKLRTA